MPCTNYHSTWCPEHGDCTCDHNGPDEDTDIDPACPLHGTESKHRKRGFDRPTIYDEGNA